MKDKQKSIEKMLWVTVALLLVLFAVLLLLLRTVDVQAVGPEGSEVGLATLNMRVHEMLGEHALIYDITEILGILALAVACGFALFGLWQCVKRKSLRSVDRDLFLLAGLYLFTLGVYVLFEIVVINHRPMLIDGVLEASFPSSHTLLVICILESAVLEWKKRISTKWLRIAAILASHTVAALTVIGRLVSGVHWLTDIIGSILLGGAMVAVFWLFFARLEAKAE